MNNTTLKAKDINYSSIPIEEPHYYTVKETQVNLVPEDAQRLDRIAEALEAIANQLRYLR